MLAVLLSTFVLRGENCPSDEPENGESECQGPVAFTDVDGAPGISNAAITYYEGSGGRLPEFCPSENTGDPFAMGEVGNDNGTLFFCAFLGWTVESASEGTVEAGCVRDIPEGVNTRIHLVAPGGARYWIEIFIERDEFDVVGVGRPM